MNTVTLQLSADMEQKLRNKARELGQTLEIYLQQVINTAVTNATIPGPAARDANERAPVANEPENFPKFISRSKLSANELEHLLDEFSAGPTGKVLPPDFSRADIYDDQDVD